MQKICVLLQVVIVLISSSCALRVSRTYEDIMEAEEVAFFEPYRDFEVIPGDTGVTGRSLKEAKKRTPLAYSEEKKFLSKKLFKAQLEELESRLDEESKNDYQAYKKENKGVSQRIHYLQSR
jgi:hypothetical protein